VINQASGFFAAITCAEASPGVEVTVFEKGHEFLSKVRISGGGRCNVTHACFNPRDFATRYPRGEKALLAPFQKFSARDTVAWFESRGVKLKTEADGRMFPVSDSSETVVNCLLHSARAAKVKLRLNCGVESAVKNADGGFKVTLATERRSHVGVHALACHPNKLKLELQHAEAVLGAPGETLVCDRLLLATGGCRAAAAGQLAVSLGHTLEPPVPSLFTFRTESPWLRSLAGISVEPVEVSVPLAKLRERGPLLITHRGLSGPAILRLSAWGARALHGFNYQFPLHVNWLPQLHAEAIAAELKSRQAAQPARLVVNVPVTPSASSITTAQPLTVTVAVSGGTGNPTPTGSVTLSGGGYTSAATTLNGASAMISIPAGSLTTGTDTLTVSHTPDSSSSSTYNTATGTSSAVTVTTPVKTTPTVAVTPFASSITTAQVLSVTITVTGGTGSPTPTGSVTFLDGTKQLGQGTLTNGVATLSVSTLTAGSHIITVSYAGDQKFLAGTSAPIVAITTQTSIRNETRQVRKVVRKPQTSGPRRIRIPREPKECELTNRRVTDWPGDVSVSRFYSLCQT